MPAGRHSPDPGQQLDLAVGRARVAPFADEAQLRLVVRGDDARVRIERDLPLRTLRDDPGAGECARAVRPKEPAGMVVVEVAHRHDVDAGRVEARPLERRDDRRTVEHSPCPTTLIEPFADPSLHEDAAGRRLDQQAVERLEQPTVRIDLVRHELAPQDPRHRPEERARIRAERAGLDEGDPDSGAEVGRPVDGVAERHAARVSPANPGRVDARF